MQPVRQNFLKIRYYADCEAKLPEDEIVMQPVRQNGVCNLLCCFWIVGAACRYPAQYFS
jgi:hypothetical protein